MKQRGSTWFLRAVLILMGLGVLALCIFALPAFARGATIEFPMFTTFKSLFLIGMYASAIVFYVALYQTLKLLKYIDTNTAFSELSVHALKTIKYCGIAIGVLYLVSLMPLIYIAAEVDDAPGLILVGMAYSCSPFVVAVFAAVLQKLVQNAIDIKAENDLTV